MGSKGIKVLMVGPYPLVPGVVCGGIESATSALVPALAARDDVESVTVLRFHDGDAPTAHRREGPKVEVHYLPGQRRWRAATGAFLDRRRARRLAATVRPDVVHGQEIGLYGDIAQRCAGNAVVTVHGVTLAGHSTDTTDHAGLRGRVRDRLIRDLERRVLRRGKVVISISKWDTEVLDVPIRGTRVSIPNATGPEFFALAPPRRTPPHLLFAGVLAPNKNPAGVVKAFAQVRMSLPEATLTLAGPQPDERYARLVRDRIRALGLEDSVEIAGPIGNEQMCREITEARAVVLFSRQENAPTIIAQAMAAGKPVVASRVGGIPEMVDDGETGFLVEPGDEAMLADRMLKLLVDPALAQRLGERAHEVAKERYSAEKVAAMTVEAYRKAMA
ncbi:glycosyltransferase family 4 protein [Mycobacterium sp. NAZ190054]|uniref:glycosyltransferase family 4 protein n=1 Tax=Mycobacterium sp. NAZ190054 TaxID=1747766 RepID=UPI0007934173|nr:glycosyltransferase family 4 protein [Mycobacterium sp. NAZ190054]KWX66509.1 hypothetical protein ASJ79_06070 [Mycobacterium sp. NAZ190054]